MTILALLLSYLIGSVPTGLWLGLTFRGVNIREHGSKNIGATNTLRVLGTKLGVLALLSDMAKGGLAVVLGMSLSEWSHAPLACGLAAIFGHTASLFLKFRGGKGVATSAGVFFALAPLSTLIATVVFAAVVSITRMVSASSMAAAITLAISVWAIEDSSILKFIAVAVAIFVVYRHRDNIKRIMDGTENRF